MTKPEVIERIADEKLFAVLRLQRTEHLESVVQSIVKGGISIIEVTLNSKNAFDCIHRISRAFPQCMVGAGTVIGYDLAVKAIESGAKFLVSPVTDLDMLAVASQVGVACMAGALTPTEAWQATQAGADFVKVFPLAGLGPNYIKALRGPLPDIRFVPTNGVSLDNISEFLEAGAFAIGVGSPLVTDRDIEIGDLHIIEERARKVCQAVQSFSPVTIDGIEQ